MSVAGQVATCKRIGEIEFVETIPKSPSGMILGRVLRGRSAAQRQAGPMPAPTRPAAPDRHGRARTDAPSSRAHPGTRVYTVPFSSSYWTSPTPLASTTRTHWPDSGTSPSA